jgi:hypothetical protein
VQTPNPSPAYSRLSIHVGKPNVCIFRNHPKRLPPSWWKFLFQYQLLRCPVHTITTFSKTLLISFPSIILPNHQNVPEIPLFSTSKLHFLGCI